MKTSNRLVMTSLRVIPAHMERLSVVAASKRLNSAAVIRMLIAEYLRRAARKDAIEKAVRPRTKKANATGE